MASIWKGSLAFGLVNIPVELKPAVRSDNLSFRLLHAEDLSPVRYERVCQADGEPVPWGEIVKGYEYAKGQYVVLTDADFKAAALEASGTIEILDFVKQDEIDPRFFETPYFLVPGKGGEKGYALLREAMRRTGAVGIGKIIIRQSQHLAAVKVIGDALVLDTMRFASELVDVDDLAFPKAESVRAEELAMAEQLIKSLAGPFEPGKYTDEYRANLLKIIRAKMKGKKAVELDEPSEARADAHVIDLMARLRASLEQREGGTRRVPVKGRRMEVVRAGRKRAAAAERKPARSRRRRTA